MIIKHEMKNWWKPKTIPESRVTNPRNTTLNWYTADNLENYLKTKPAGYDENSITYKFNEHGFRTRPFDLNSIRFNIFFLGCSHTFGVGLRENDTWVRKIINHFDNDERYCCYNLGVAGGSSDSVTRLFANSIKSDLHPSIVFILWPPKARFDYYNQEDKIDCWETHGPWAVNKETMFLYDDINVYNHFLKNKLIVDTLAKINNITLIELEVDDLFEHELPRLPPPVDRARDNHLAPSIHTYIADRFMTLYKFIENTKDSGNASK